ncbi:DUF6241 domain-containing protein [Bacillus sp. CFBP9009]
MKKTILIIGGLLVSVALIFVAGNLTSKNDVIVKEKQQSNGEKTFEIQETGAAPVEEEYSMKMSEEEIQNAIHVMSHQKVEAEDKWGFVPITSERIEQLIAVIEKNEYREQYLYLGILNGWKNNDFSNVDEDHNDIWKLQGGNIGKARGILTPEEEKAYIEKHYDIKETDY